MRYEAILCYIEGDTAYFTTQDLDKQTGDGWDDAPYELNAEPPYTSDEGKWEIYKVKFQQYQGYETPETFHPGLSVDDINSKKVPWLRKWDGIIKDDIYAGDTLAKFLEKMKEHNIDVYFTTTAIHNMFMGFVWVLECLIPGGLDQALATEYIDEVPPNWWIYDLVPEFLSNPIYDHEAWKREQSGHSNQFYKTEHDPINPHSGHEDHPCIKCDAMCCREFQNIPIVPGDTPPPSSLTEVRDGHLYMQRIDGVCVALKDNRCTIYDIRPKACRDFEEGEERCLKIRREVCQPEDDQSNINQE
jgi:hypothetical protein